jgi:isopenicillin-N epimerase
MVTNTFEHVPPDDHGAWAPLQEHWSLRHGTIYLNHGSFGPPPAAVRRARQAWQDALDSQPMDFFVRRLEGELAAARQKLEQLVGAGSGNLIFVENATVGMNIVADSFPLAAGDEVLLTDHEYGAVERIWQRAAARAGAAVRRAVLPLPLRSPDDVVEAIVAAATPRTRLLVISHITSPTAIILPVAAICRAARERGIAVAIDGPHAVAQVPVDLQVLGCDYYAASCHKWLSGPFGSGFLYVAPPRQAAMSPPVLSWGRLPPGKIESWADEYAWSGTRNPTAYLAVPAAIEFLESVGLDAFRRRTHWLAQRARALLMNLSQLEPLVPDDAAWYGSMAHVPLPPARREPAAGLSARDASCPVSNPLQHLIWQRLGIESPVVLFQGRRYLRVSCHLYNNPEQLEALAAGLAGLLAEGH